MERGGPLLQVAQRPGRVAADHAPLVLRWKNGQAVRLQDVGGGGLGAGRAQTSAGQRQAGMVLLQVYKQPGANILEAVERVRSLLPALQASIPAAIDIEVVSDRTPTLRASVKEVETRC